MAKEIYVGAGGVKKVKEIYVGAGGVKKVKTGYLGAGGVKQFYEDIPAYPSTFTRSTTYMHDSDKAVTFTAPKKAWYRIHVVGDGGAAGNLGRMIMDKTGSKDSAMYGGGASSGSTGAYAIHDALMNQGDTIAITLNTTQCQAVVKSSISGSGTIIAKHGVKGLATAAQSLSNSEAWRSYDGGVAADASAVTASGGNVINLNGVKGKDGPKGNGSSIEIDNQSYNKTSDGADSVVISDARAKYTPKSIVKGGQGGYVLRYRPGSKAGTKVSAISNETSLGGSCAGQGGSYLQGTSSSGELSRKEVSAQTGNPGGVGGVVIEVGA